MPRRGGKAATRQARQQRARERGPVRPPADAVQQAASAAATTATPSRTAPPPRPSPPTPERVPYAPASSSLSERARAEYRYVSRDLRSIARVTVVMAAMLAAAFIAFRVLELGPI